MDTNTVPVGRHVRTTDPKTSWNAAKIEPEAWSDLQRAIVDILRDAGPLTDDELHREYLARNYQRRSQSRIRTARKELQLSGIVAPAETLGRSRMGNESQRWEVISR